MVEKDFHVGQDWCFEVTEELSELKTLMTNHLAHHNMLIKYLVCPILVALVIAMGGHVFSLIKLAALSAALVK